jgi:hypothetical protein
LFSLTVNVELALKTFRENVGKVTQLLCAAVPIIAKVDWSVTIQELKVKRLNKFDEKNCTYISFYRKRLKIALWLDYYYPSILHNVSAITVQHH